MVALLGWVSTATGLPSFRATGPGVLLATDAAGTRTVARLTTSRQLMFSDSLARPAFPTVYQLGATHVTLTRARGDGPDIADTATISDITGRSVVVDFYEDTGDPRAFKSGYSKYANGVLRYGFGLPDVQGESRLYIDGPEKVDELTALLEDNGPVIITLGAPADGVPMVRCVWVREVKRVRNEQGAEFVFDVKWEPQPLPDLPEASGLVPVVTWDMVQASAWRWGDTGTFNAVIHELTGMPL